MFGSFGVLTTAPRPFRTTWLSSYECHKSRYGVLLDKKRCPAFPLYKVPPRFKRSTPALPQRACLPRYLRPRTYQLAAEPGTDLQS